MFRPFHPGRDSMTGIADPFSMLRHQISSVFDQFPGGGGGVGGGGWERGGQGGAGGETISFGPSIEDFSSLGGAREGGRAGGGRGGETGGELQTKGGGSGDVTALGPIMPFVGQLVPRISLDLVEQPDKYIVHAEVPGVKKDEIKLSVENGVLTVTAEKRDQHVRQSLHHTDQRGYRVVRREIGYGTVTRAIRLPRDAKAEEVKAKFDNGILEIEIPKQQERGEKKERGNVNIQ